MPRMDPRSRSGRVAPRSSPRAAPLRIRIANLLAILLVATIGCSAPVREQAQGPGQNARGVPKSAKSKSAPQKKAVIRGTLASNNAGDKDPDFKIEESVIFVVGAPPTEHRPDHVSIGQTSTAFTPRVSMVAIGDTAVFENRDRIYHSVFSVSPARRFELGTYGPGTRRSVSFDRRGNVRVFCDMHSATSGYIYVVPSPVATRPSHAGKWSLPPLPPGRYQVCVWHPERGERQWTVDLPAKGLSRDLRF